MDTALRGSRLSGRAVSGPSARRAGFAMLLLAASVVMGGVGYYVIERNWSLGDAFYMAVLGLTTVGFDEVHELSEAGRRFTMVFLSLNLVLGIYAATSITSYLLEGQVGGAIRRQRLERQLARLKDHFIVCGYGRVGCAAAHELRRSGRGLVVVDRREASVARASEAGLLVLEGCAFEEDVLHKAGIERAAGGGAALGEEAENITLTLTVRDLRRDVPIVARANGESEERLLRRAGATHVISPYEIGGVRMASMLTRPQVVQFLDVTTHAGECDFRLDSVPVTETSRVAGKVLRETTCFTESSTIVVGIIAPAGDVTVNPPRGTRLLPGSTLIVLGDDAQLAHLRSLLAV